MSDGKYNDKMCARIIKLAKEGKTNEEIAFYVGVCRKTLNNWQNKYPELKESLRDAKTLPDDEIEISLHKKAKGFSKKAVKHFYDKDLGKVVEHEYLEYYPPDTNAAKFWLLNRRPEQWREKSVVEHEGLQHLTDEELLAEKARLLAIVNAKKD